MKLGVEDQAVSAQEDALARAELPLPRDEQSNGRSTAEVCSPHYRPW